MRSSATSGLDRETLVLGLVAQQPQLVDRLEVLADASLCEHRTGVPADPLVMADALPRPLTRGHLWLAAPGSRRLERVRA